MLVYQKIKAYIDSNGIEQNVVAQKANFPIATFNAMMNGKRKCMLMIYGRYAMCVNPEIFIDVFTS